MKLKKDNKQKYFHWLNKLDTFKDSLWWVNQKKSL